MAAQTHKQIDLEAGDGTIVTFQIRQLPPITALRLSAKLFPVFASLIGGVKVVNGKAVGNSALDLVALSTKIDAAFLDELRETFGPYSSVLEVHPKHGELWPDLKDVAVYNRTFGGRVKLSFLWLIECVKFNYADFLSGFLAAKSEAGEEKKEASGSPSI